MTPGDEPLICRCGNHSAKFVPSKKKQPSRWMVLAVKAPGQKPQPITTLASKDKALQRVQLICNSSSSLSDHTSAEPPTQVPQPSVSHQRHLRNRTAVDYDDTVRIASCPAGPGRGHKRQPESALVGADAVLKNQRPVTKS